MAQDAETIGIIDRHAVFKLDARMLSAIMMSVIVTIAKHI